VGGGEEFDVASVEWDFGSGADGAKDAVQGVTDVFEFGVEFVTAVLEPVLEAFKQVSREVGAVTGGIAMGADGVEAIDDQRVVAGRRAGQTAGIEPAGRPGECVEQHAAVALEVGRGLAAIEAPPEHFEQFRDRAL